MQKPIIHTTTRWQDELFLETSPLARCGAGFSRPSCTIRNEVSACLSLRPLRLGVKFSASPTGIPVLAFLPSFYRRLSAFIGGH
jgi:hypothetical protein